MRGTGRCICGNWSAAPHIDLEMMLSSDNERTRWGEALKHRGLSLCALNCSGNPLAYKRDWQVTVETFQLAELLGVKKIVMMSGLPSGCPGDTTGVDYDLLAARNAEYSAIPVV